MSVGPFGVVHELNELDGLLAGGAAIGAQGEEQKGKDVALWDIWCWSSRSQRHISPASHAIGSVFEVGAQGAQTA